jgi:hypothetical protein
MEQIELGIIKGKEISNFHTRQWKRDNNKIWCYMKCKPLPEMMLMDVSEIMKIKGPFASQKFRVFKKTTKGPTYIEVC